jgi:hypothetical protein
MVLSVSIRKRRFPVRVMLAHLKKPRKQSTKALTKFSAKLQKETK